MIRRMINNIFILISFLNVIKIKTLINKIMNPIISLPKMSIIWIIGKKLDWVRDKFIQGNPKGPKLLISSIDVHAKGIKKRALSFFFNKKDIKRPKNPGNNDRYSKAAISETRTVVLSAPEFKPIQYKIIKFEKNPNK